MDKPRSIVATSNVDLVVGLVVGLLGLVSAGVAEDEHAHVAIVEDTSLTVSHVIDETLREYPSFVELEARDAQARAWRDRGRSWLADRPSLTFRYQSDRWGDDNGLDEYESGIQLPLWRWGQRAATRSLGQALETGAMTASLALRWQVAGQVRSHLWDVALALNERELAAQALSNATQLADTVQRRFELGDVPRSDVLLSRTAQLEAQSLLINAEALALDAERSYGSLTTLDRRPPFAGEQQSAKTEIGIDHPALVFANAELQQVQARNEVVRQTAKRNMSLLVGPRRERSAFNQSFEESIGMTVSVPFGGAAHARSQAADVGRDVARAHAAQAQLVRELNLQLHEAEHGLYVARQNLMATQTHAELAEQHQTMADSAYEKGEIDLIDLIKIQTAALAAKRQLMGLQIEEKRQIAFYNQAVGELP